MPDKSDTGSFGRCEVCGKPREAELVDGDLVLQCPDGHQTLLLTSDLTGSVVIG